MNRRHFLSVVGVSGLSALSGCQSGESSSSVNETTATTTTTTGSSTQDTTTSRTVSGESFDLPEGFSVDGVMDGEKVMESHLSSLQGTTYTLLFEQEIEFNSNNYVEKIDRKNTQGVILDKKTGAEWYFDTEYMYFNHPEENRYNASSIDESTLEYLFTGQMDFTVFGRLPQYQYSDPTFELIDGHQVAQFEIQNEHSGKLTVMPDGTVKEILVEDSEGFLFNYETTNIGATTVEKPGWVNEVSTTSN